MTQEQQDEINKMVEDLMTSPEAKERIELISWTMTKHLWALSPPQNIEYATKIYGEFLFDQLAAKLNGTTSA